MKKSRPPSPFDALVEGRSVASVAAEISLAPSQVFQWLRGQRVPSPATLNDAAVGALARTVGHEAVPGLVAGGRSLVELAELGALLLVCRAAREAAPGGERPR